MPKKIKPSETGSAFKAAAHVDDAFTFNKYLPSEALRGFVDYYWHLKTTSPLLNPVGHTILPDGSFTIMFNFGEDDLISGSKILGTSRQCYKNILLGRVDVLAIKFTPGGFFCLSGINASDFFGKLENFDSVAGRIAKIIFECISECRIPEERIMKIDETLQTLFKKSNVVIPEIIKSVMNYLVSKNRFDYKKLSEIYNLGSKNVYRQFKKCIGVSPRELAVILRFQHAMRGLIEKDGNEITDLIYESGYYDQPHFIHEFKLFMGMTPGEFVARMRGI